MRSTRLVHRDDVDSELIPCDPMRSTEITARSQKALKPFIAFAVCSHHSGVDQTLRCKDTQAGPQDSSGESSGGPWPVEGGCSRQGQGDTWKRKLQPRSNLQMTSPEPASDQDLMEDSESESLCQAVPEFLTNRNFKILNNYCSFKM